MAGVLHYDPTTARFLTRDPIEALTRSAYGYTANNPINLVDRTGMAPWDGLGDVWDATGGKLVTFADKNRALAATFVSVAGYALCPASAGIGCVVGQVGSYAAAGFAGVDAVAACRTAGVMSTDCGLGVADFVLAGTGARAPGRFINGGNHFAPGAFGLPGNSMERRFWNLSFTGGASFASLSMHTGEDFVDARHGC